MKKSLLVVLIIIVLLIIGCESPSQEITKAPESTKIQGEQKVDEYLENEEKETIITTDKSSYKGSVGQIYKNGDIDSTKKATFTIYNVIGDGYTNSEPKTYGDYVVWISDKNDNQDLFLKNMKTGEIKQITTNEGDDYSPLIWDNKIIYLQKEEYYFSSSNKPISIGIYMYSIDTKEKEKIIVDCTAEIENNGHLIDVSRPGVFDFNNGLLYYVVRTSQGTANNQFIFDISRNTPCVSGKLPERIIKVCGEKNCYEKLGEVCPYPFNRDRAYPCDILGINGFDKIHEHYLFHLTNDGAYVYDFNYNQPTDSTDELNKAITHLLYPKDRKRINEFRGITIEEIKNCLKESGYYCEEYELYYKIFIPSKEESYILKGGTYTQSPVQEPKKIKDGDSPLTDRFLEESADVVVERDKIFFVESKETCTDYPEGEYCRWGKDIYMIEIT